MMVSRAEEEPVFKWKHFGQV